MTAASAVDRSQEYAFSDSDFRLIADFAKKRFGLDLQPSKKPLVYSRISKRLRILGLNRFSDYWAYLQDDADEEEIAHLLTSLTTNVTHFFREKHHFDYLATEIAPDLVKRAEAGEKIRIWSAACSAGQEAFCIAATLMSVTPKLGHYDVRILATDIDPNMIKKAKSARYPAEQLQAIPEPFRAEMLASASAPGEIEMTEALRSLISFAELNLISEWPMQRQFDVIFCRNAAIYFDKQTQARLWDRFAKMLKPGGYLMIGHSERLSGPAERSLTSVGITTYAKQQLTHSTAIDVEKVS